VRRFTGFPVEALVPLVPLFEGEGAPIPLG